MRDAIGTLAAWGQVQWEPVVRGSTLVDCNSDTLIADLRMRGVWQPQACLACRACFTPLCEIE